MVRNQYGKTAWGKAFLDALGRMDTNARLGRGKSYANTGKVLSINVTGPKITSRVQGREDVYSVAVTFQEFSTRDKQSVYAIIEQNPLVLAHILNGELPDSLLDVLDKSRIFLLPSSWQEIKGRCSCPDFGNPCKHMAAVYFLLTSEIDKNPFTLFMLRGVDLMQYFSIKNSETEPSYPLPVTMATCNAAFAGTDSVDCGTGPNLPECELLKHVPMGNFILDCLSPNPPFSSQLDFKDVMIEFYRHAAKKTGPVISAPKEVDQWFTDVDMDSFQRIWSQSHFEVRLSDRFSEGIVYFHNEMFDEVLEPASVLGNVPFSAVPPKIKIKTKDAEDHQASEEKWLKLELFSALRVFLRLTSDFGTPSYRYLFYAARVSLVLMNSQSYIPDVLPLTHHQGTGKLTSFKVIWKPLFSCSVVEQQLKNLMALYPLQLKPMDCERATVVLEKKPLDAKSAGLHLLSSLLTSLVSRLEFMHKKCKNNPPKESMAFFCGQTFHVLSLAEQNVPKAIVKYFGVFELMKTDFDVSVHVDKPASGFSVNVASQASTAAGGSTQGGEQYTMGLWFKRTDADSSHSLPIRSFLQTFPGDRNKVLKFLSSLSPYLNNVEQLLLRDSLSLVADDLEVFILQTSRMLTNLGVKVLLPKELRKVLKPRAVVRTRSKSRLDEEKQSKQSFLRMAQLLSYNWMVSIGDEVVSVEEFEAMVKSGKKLIKFKDKYIEISADEMKNILAAIRKPPPHATPMELLKETLLENRLYHLDSDVSEFLNGFLRVSDTQVPVDLSATLREYQVKGYQWLISNLVNGFGCILADDMGLGKTIQTIATILHLKKRGLLPHPALVVVPTTLLVNWRRELRKFAPGLTVSTYYGAGRCLAGLDADGESHNISGNSAAVQQSEPSTSAANGHAMKKMKRESSSVETESNEIDVKQNLVKIKKEEPMDVDTKPDVKAIGNHLSADNHVSLPPVLGKRASSAGVNGSLVKRAKLEESTSGDVKPNVNSLVIKCNSEVNRDLPTEGKRIKPTPKRTKSGAISTHSDDVILTTYQIAWRDLEIFQKKQFSLVCIDEAQKIKNCKSQTSKALKKIKSPMRIALSGTPVENNLSELWSVFDFTIPGYMGTLKDFSDNYAKDIELRCDQETLDALKKVISPFIMRRLKTDKNIVKDLPDKIIDNKYATLSSEQAALYEGVVDDITRQIEAASGINRRGLIFKLLTALKQICNHPANYNESASPSLETSGKMKMLVQLLEPILKEGEKVLIFTQYVRMIRLLTVMIEKHFQVKPLTLEGSMDQKKRDQAVTQFQTCPHHQIFIVSLKAGGVGLNLTAANHVIHYDLWYNPAVENQATDRAFRIGQVKNVFVYRLITQNTFEERIDEMLKRKQELSDMSISVKENWITEMSNDQLKQLFMRS